MKDKYIKLITEEFHNEEYLKRKAKQIKEINTTNAWGFDGELSTTYIMSTGSSYKTGRIDRFSSGKNEDINEFKIGKKKVTKQEFLDHNKISRKVSVKLWTHKAYEGQFDKLIEDYIKGVIN